MEPRLSLIAGISSCSYCSWRSPNLCRRSILKGNLLGLFKSWRLSMKRILSGRIGGIEMMYLMSKPKIDGWFLRGISRGEGRWASRISCRQWHRSAKSEQYKKLRWFVIIILWIDKKRGDPGIEPGTSCTLNKNHTTRPIARLDHHQPICNKKYLKNT